MDEQNFIPDVWQVVFTNVSVKGRVAVSYVYGLLYGPGHILIFPCYYFEVLQCCFMPSNVLMFKNGWWCFKVFLTSLFKSSGWFPNILLVTFSPATLEPIYGVALFCLVLSVLLEHQQVPQCVPPWNAPGYQTCCRCSCSSHIVLLSKAPLCDIFYLFDCCCYCLPSFLFSSLVLQVVVGVLFYLVPTLDTYNGRGLLQCVLILSSAAQNWNKLLWPCVWGCWSHWIYKPGGDGCPTEGINQCVWAFCTHRLSRFYPLLVLPMYPGMAWNHLP